MTLETGSGAHEGFLEERQKLIAEMRNLQTEFWKVWRGSRDGLGSTKKGDPDRVKALELIEDKVLESQVHILLNELDLQQEFAMEGFGEWIRECKRNALERKLAKGPATKQRGASSGKAA